MNEENLIKAIVNPENRHRLLRFGFLTIDWKMQDFAGKFMVWCNSE